MPEVHNLLGCQSDEKIYQTPLLYMFSSIYEVYSEFSLMFSTSEDFQLMGF